MVIEHISFTYGARFKEYLLRRSQPYIHSHMVSITISYIEQRLPRT